MVLVSVAFEIEPPFPTVSMSLCSASSAKPSPSDTSGCSSRHFAGLHQRLIRSLNSMGGTIDRGLVAGCAPLEPELVWLTAEKRAIAGPALVYERCSPVARALTAAASSSPRGIV